MRLPDPVLGVLYAVCAALFVFVVLAVISWLVVVYEGVML